MNSAPRGLVARIFAAWPDFRASMRRELAAGRDEPQLLAYAMGASAALFLAALPRILVIPPAQVAAAGPEGAFGYFLANLVTFLFFVPLALYGVAALARLTARAAGGAGGWAETRLATFWAILVASPALLAASTANLLLTLGGVPGAGAAANLAAGAASAWIWSACLAEAHGFRRPALAFAAIVAATALLSGALYLASSGPGVTT